MKKHFLLISGFLILSGFSYAQTTAQSNGVIVHQAQGVETVQEKSAPVSIVRTMNDWTLAECIDALHVLELKMAEATLQEDKDRYQNDKIKLVKRINELKQAN